MATLEEMLGQIDDLEEELITLEQELVRIPSVNTGSMPTGNETPVCNYIRKWVLDDGIQSDILFRDPERGNIISRLEAVSYTHLTLPTILRV